LQLQSDELIHTTSEGENAYHVRLTADKGISFEDIMEIKKDAEDDFYEQQNSLRNILIDRGERAEANKKDMFGFYTSNNSFQGHFFILCVLERVPMRYVNIILLINLLFNTITIN